MNSRWRLVGGPYLLSCMRLRVQCMAWKIHAYRLWQHTIWRTCFMHVPNDGGWIRENNCLWFAPCPNVNRIKIVWSLTNKNPNIGENKNKKWLCWQGYFVRLCTHCYQFSRVNVANIWHSGLADMFDMQFWLFSQFNNTITLAIY